MNHIVLLYLLCQPINSESRIIMGCPVYAQVHSRSLSYNSEHSNILYGMIYNKINL